MHAPLFSSFLSILFILPALIFALECVENDKKALLKIKNKFGNPKELSSWIPTTDCCTQWTGVSCDVSLGQVLSLNISNTKNISGPIPDAIGDLPILSYITLHNLPFLTGPLPISLSNLTLLKILTITYTSLAGPLPPFITTFTQLLEFNLSHNLISGPLPAFPGDTYYSIDLSHNYLSGSIPSSLLSGTVSTPILDISYNKLTGKIPRSLGKINFSWISMAHNKLTGDASFLFGVSKWATLIDLSWNELEFNMSSLRFSTSLENLDLSHNNISGSIPRQIASAEKLKALNLSYNKWEHVFWWSNEEVPLSQLSP